MTLPASARRSRALFLAVAIVLIAAPWVAWGLKLFSFGWITIALVWTVVPILLLIGGYVVQLVIAIQGFLGRRPAFAFVPGDWRGVAAALATSFGVLLTGFTLVDGGDVSWGSTLMYAFGAASDPAAADVSNGLGVLGIVLWIGGWIWLAVEWIVALAARGRASRATAASGAMQWSATPNGPRAEGS